MAEKPSFGASDEGSYISSRNLRSRISWRTDGLLIMMIGLVASMVVFVQPQIRSARAVDNEINYTANSVWESGSVDDSVSGAISLPFAFTYFGSNFSQAVMSSNGVLTFGASGSNSWSNTALPGAINNTIYAFWDDLMVQSVGGASQTTVLYQTVGTAPNRKFIGQWTGIYFYGTTVQMGTFQVGLSETSHVVQIQYRNIVGTGRSQGSEATIGLQGSSSQYLQFLANTASPLLVDGFALRYTPSGSTYTVTSGANYDPVYLVPASGVASPVLSAPTDGATDVATTPTLSWSAATNATGYKVYLATDSQFTTSSLVGGGAATITGGSTTQWSPPSALNVGTKYYWRVESLRNTLSSLSGTRTFTTSSVTKSPQSTLTVTTSATDVSVGSTVALSTSGGSGTGAVTYAIASGSAYCSVSGATLTAVSAGTCSVTATKATDSSYYSATSSAVAITVSPVVTRTVSYSGNGNTGGSVPANGTGNSGSTFTVSANSGSLVRAGYTFGGWNTAANGSGTTYAAGTGSFTLNADIALYAVWTANTLTVTFDTQGGSAIASSTTTTGASIATSPGTPTFDGRSFNGWYATSSGGSAITFPYAHGRTSNFTLYAQWLINQAALSINGAPATLSYLGSTTVSLTGGSGIGAVQYSTSTPSICSVHSSSGLVTMSSASGICRVVATKASDGTYAFGSTSVEITATKATQSTLTINGASSGVFGSTVSLSASGGSTAGAVTWSANSSSACSVSNAGAVSITSGTGSCAVTATMAGNGNYLAVTSATFTISVSKAAQAPLVVSSVSAVFGVALTLGASGGSGSGAISYVVSAGSCFVLGSLLTVGDAGSTCEVVATKAGDDDYNEVSSTSTAITTLKAAQAALTVSTTSATYGQTLTLVSSGGSGDGAVSFAVVSGTCSISGSSLTPGNAGSSCVVKATKATDTNYNEVSSANTTITIAKANQATLTVTTTSGTFGVPLTLATSGGSGNGAVSYAVVSGACSVSGSTLTASAAGSTCVVKATKATDTNYEATSTADTTVVFAKGSQSALTVSTTSATFGFTLTLATTGGSGTGSVTYAVSAGSCFVVGSLLTVGNAGSTCEVVATKAGDDDYNEVSSVSTSITTLKATQEPLMISSRSATFGQVLDLTMTGGSGTGAVSFTVVSGTCSISGSSLTPGNAGSSCVVKATKATDTNYNERSSANTTITIGKANQTGIRVTSNDFFTTGSSLTLTATGGQSTGALSWSLQSGTCSLSGSNLTANRGGISCVIEATRAGDSNYHAGSVTKTITVSKIPQVLTFRSTPPTLPVVGSTYTVTVESDVSLAATIAIANSSATVCSITAGVVTFNAVGTCLISASQAGSDVYAPAAASQSVTVTAVPVTTTIPVAGGASSPTTMPVVTTTIPQSAVAAIIGSTSTPVGSTTTTTTTTTTIPADPSKPILGADGEPVELAEGETTVLIRGQEVVVNTRQEDGQLIMELPNKVVVRIGAKATGGTSSQVGADGVLRAYRNSEVEVELTGLVPGTTYTIFMFSTPVELGRGAVSADGAVSQLVKLPSAAEIGSHTMQVNGVGPGGEVVSVSMGMKVEKKQSNTATAIVAISAAILLALLGGRPIFRRRRRAI